MALLKVQSLELFVFSVVGRKRDLVVLEIALLGRWYMVFLDERLVYLNLIGFFPIILQPILLILQMPVNAKLTWIFFFFVLVIGVQHILQDYFSLLIPISNILLENLERRCVTHQQFSMSLGFHNSSARKRINTTLQLLRSLSAQPGDKGTECQGSYTSLCRIHVAVTDLPVL